MVKVDEGKGKGELDEGKRKGRHQSKEMYLGWKEMAG